MDVQQDKENQQEITKDFLNIQKVFYTKSPSLAKIIPKFFLQLFKKNYSSI